MPPGPPPNVIKQAPGFACLGSFCISWSTKSSSGSTSSRGGGHSPEPVPTTHPPSTIAILPTLPQEISPTAHPETSDKSSLGLVPTAKTIPTSSTIPTSNTIPISSTTPLIGGFPIQSTKPNISTSSPPGPSSTNGTQLFFTSTNPLLSSSAAQFPTTALIPSLIVTESTLSHTGVDPRIIVPIILIAVALAVGCAIIWLKKIKGRRTSPREEMLKSGETQMDGAGGVPRIHLEESNEKSGRLMRDTENTLDSGFVEDEIGRGEGDWDSQAEVLSRRDGGYGWGLGKQDDKLSGLEEQEDMHEPAPAYSRDPY